MTQGTSNLGTVNIYVYKNNSQDETQNVKDESSKGESVFTGENGVEFTEDQIEYLEKAGIDISDILIHKDEEVKETEEVEKTEETEETEKTAAPEESKLSETDAIFLAEQINASILTPWGVDKEQIASILQNENFSSADIAQILNTYNSKYSSSLIADLDKIGDTNSLSRVTDALLEQVEKGDQASIDSLCKEFQNSLNNGGAFGWMNLSNPSSFASIVFEKGSDEAIYQLYNNYWNVNEKNIASEIKDAFSGAKEDKMLDRINDAIAKHVSQ